MKRTKILCIQSLLNPLITIGLYVVALFLGCVTHAQTGIDINTNVKHEVGGISTFQRSRFINVHSTLIDQEWDGDNFTKDLRQDVLEDRNVYLGRDAGGVSWYLNDISEDPNRIGFADPEEITSKGAISKEYFKYSLKDLHKYRERQDVIIGPPFHVFWAGKGKQPTKKGWTLASAEASGEFIGRYVNAFFGEDNEPKTPKYIEIVNEPAYERLGGAYNYTNSIEEIANYHLEAVKAIKAQVPNVKVGGYTTAFPNLEVGNFKRWENRWKHFIDTAGSAMDFWSVHLYDFPAINNGKVQLRSGSNIEATFDMIDHYSKLTLGEVKPYIISEYGAQCHDYFQEQWSSYRDWLHIKALNAQLMAFLERPNTIAKAMPFIVLKGEWGMWGDIPHQTRLLRKENEPASYTGKWVYTDLIKFYELWKDVKGTRIDTKSTNPDVLVDAYIDGDKLYVIINNLKVTPEAIALNLIDTSKLTVTKIEKKHLTLIDKNVVLEKETLANQKTVTLGAASTMVLTYSFNSPLTIHKTLKETKYYADTYYQPIVSQNPVTFKINNVRKSNHGEAVLRLGVGRDHSKSLQPKVNINGNTIELPTDWRGYNQADRERFFGVLEIPFSYKLLNEGDNEMTIEFPDTGGHISSCALQVFNISKTMN